MYRIHHMYRSPCGMEKFQSVSLIRLKPYLPTPPHAKSMQRDIPEVLERGFQSDLLERAGEDTLTVFQVGMFKF